MTIEVKWAGLDGMLKLHIKPCGGADVGECLEDTRAAIRNLALSVLDRALFNGESGLTSPHGSCGSLTRPCERCEYDAIRTQIEELGEAP